MNFEELKRAVQAEDIDEEQLRAFWNAPKQDAGGNLTPYHREIIEGAIARLLEGDA